MKEWMEPKLSKPTQITLDRVKALLSVGIPKPSIASCCSHCRDALRWLDRRVGKLSSEDKSRVK